MILELGDDWSTVDDEWTPDQFILEFWEHSRRRVRQRWSDVGRTRHMADWDELYGVAIEALIRFAYLWPAWCEEHDVDPAVKGKFWGGCKRAIDWDITQYVERRARITLSVEANYRDSDAGSPIEDELGRTEIQRIDLRQSLLLGELVDAFESEPLVNRVVCALYFFEDMPQGRIVDLLGYNGKVSVGHLTTQTARRMLNVGQRAVLDDPPKLLKWSTVGRRPWKAPAPLERWLQDTYGITHPETYVTYVASHFRADVSYMADLINLANGGKRSNRYEFVDTALTERQRAVLDVVKATAGGTPMIDIAEAVTGIRLAAKVYHTIEQLERMGYLQPRERNTRNGIHLSDKGRAA